jgi:hypothetical protein
MTCSTKTPCRSVRSCRSGLRLIALLLGLSTFVFLSACDRDSKHTVHNSNAKPVLFAQPNPVPAGDLDQPTASTQVSWNAGGNAIGDLYVKVNRSPEVFLAHGPSGTIRISWIQFESTYEFRLYTKKHRLLAKLDVTRDN